MGGVYFGHSYLYFLYISLCTILNESLVEQFFILSLLDSETGLNTGHTDCLRVTVVRQV